MTHANSATRARVQVHDYTHTHTTTFQCLTQLSICTTRIFYYQMLNACLRDSYIN